jgi:hypothetical protein
VVVTPTVWALPSIPSRQREGCPFVPETETETEAETETGAESETETNAVSETEVPVRVGPA